VKTRPFLENRGVLGKLEGCGADILTEKIKCLEQRACHGPQIGRIAIQGGGGDVAWGMNIAVTRRRVGMNEYINRGAEDLIRESLRPVLHLNGC
jgi:hypothetical protein